MREYRTSGSVRGAPGNRRSYRETGLTPKAHISPGGLIGGWQNHFEVAGSLEVTISASPDRIDLIWLQNASGSCVRV